ncbi:MAG: DUF4271 domain-containing protein [Odoribacteraceae bacterium]|jgi:hypothetical protein|nr:DUF4271 domain-containing protein [Odoribacteraceae bacterium]
MNGWTVDSLARPPRGEYVEALPLVREELELGFISWTLLCMIVYLVLLVVVYLRGRGILPALFFYFFQGKNFEQLVAKRIAPVPGSLFCTLLLSFFSLSLFFVFLEGGKLAPLPLLLYSGILFANHFLLLSVASLLGWVFRARDVAREFSIHVWIYNAIPGILLAPVIFSLFYARPPASGALVFLITSLLSLYAILRWARWVKILFKHGVPVFYLILYLCALEILPLLVLYKILAGDFSQDV